jgi:molybdenum cofactor cytidylyltransferase
MTPNLSIIVLAAGLSRRMGAENKLLLPFKGQTIIEMTISNILAADIGEVIVVVGHEAKQVKAVLNNRFPNIKIVENPDFEQGMTTSIKAGIRAAQQNTEGYMICLSDMVLIQPDEYRFMVQRFLFYDFYHEEKTIAQPIFEKKRGNPVIFASIYKNALLETLDTEGCRSLVQTHKEHILLVEMATNHILQDVDIKEDYERLTK